MAYACLLCLETSFNTQIHLNTEVTGIIRKHFWLRPANNDEQICLPCWDIVRQFHQFYIRVAKAHNRFKEAKVVVDLEDEEEVDPLPPEIVLKSEETCVDKPKEALEDAFFESEVKLEVHDLDLLPQVEIIEGTQALSQRPQRRCRATGQPPNKVKRESHSDTCIGNDDDSEPELPLSMLVNVAANAAEAHAETDLFSGCAQNEGDDSAGQQQTERKKRGRPRKNVANSKANHSASTADLSADPVESGSDDSASSSGTDHDNDTDDSWRGARGHNAHVAAEPKRAVAKPKKYRKRAKPLVAPRRMTRDEIDKKNAQQAEYDRVIEQFFGKIACCKCDLLVANFGDMRRHLRATHNEDPGYMMCCGRKFHQRKALAEHVYVHWNPEHFKCQTCGRVFQDGRALEVHEATHTTAAGTEPKERKMFQCDKCPKEFTTKAALEYHAFSKHVPKSEFKFSCRECQKKLPTERKLKDHMRYMHDPESAIICDKCGKQVRSHTNLKKHHQLEHSDVPRPTPVPMQCEICGTWLRHMAGLKQHMKTIHEDTGGEHRCHICNKTSTNARALKRHIYHNHECERKFKCTMCEKAFKRPQDLREHTSTHTGEVLYTCPNCPMTFFSNANMYKHRQRLHRSEWEADKKKPMPPNIMQQAVGATAAMKMQLAVGANTAFFAQKTQSSAAPALSRTMD